ncbi:hypothetical protein CPB85DRAFT_1350697, partial [Mucidula mucida]
MIQDLFFAGPGPIINSSSSASSSSNSSPESLSTTRRYEEGPGVTEGSSAESWSSSSDSALISYLVCTGRRVCVVGSRVLGVWLRLAGVFSCWTTGSSYRETGVKGRRCMNNYRRGGLRSEANSSSREVNVQLLQLVVWSRDCESSLLKRD